MQIFFQDLLIPVWCYFVQFFVSYKKFHNSIIRVEVIVIFKVFYYLYMKQYQKRVFHKSDTVTIPNEFHVNPPLGYSEYKEIKIAMIKYKIALIIARIKEHVINVLTF